MNRAKLNCHNYKWSVCTEMGVDVFESRLIGGKQLTSVLEQWFNHDEVTDDDVAITKSVLGFSMRDQLGKVDEYDRDWLGRPLNDAQDPDFDDAYDAIVSGNQSVRLPPKPSHRDPANKSCRLFLENPAGNVVGTVLWERHVNIVWVITYY